MTTAASSGTSGFNAVSSGIANSSKATFSATYATANAQEGKSQTVTFAQSPPKWAVITTSGSYFYNGTSTTECTGSGSSATCTSLPASMSSELSGLTDLFSPTSLISVFKGLDGMVAAHVAGVSVNTSSGTYGGLASDCVTVKSPSETSAVTYCAAKSSGILTYENAGGNTVTLQSYTANPPASTFSPPAGATMETLPAGA